MADDGALWSDPGIFEIVPGVHRVPLPLPDEGLKAVNVYVIETDDGPVIVDSGWSTSQARDLLVGALSELGHQPADISRFLITHVHRDHYSMAVRLREDFGCRVGLGHGERPTLERLGRPGVTPLAAQIDRLPTLGAAQLARDIADYVKDHDVDPDEWALPDEWLMAGDYPVGQRILQAVETPGHTAGHLVFHDLDAKLLFSGDHVLPTITPSIGFEPNIQTSPLADFLASLAIVRSRPDAVLLPAHGPVRDSVHARVDELVVHHEVRLRQTAEAVGRGAVTALDVARALKWTRREHSFDSLNGFNSMLAVFETAAHLQLLVAQGRVVELEPIERVRQFIEPAA